MRWVGAARLVKWSTRADSSWRSPLPQAWLTHEGIVVAPIAVWGANLLRYFLGDPSDAGLPG